MHSLYWHCHLTTRSDRRPPRYRRQRRRPAFMRSNSQGELTWSRNDFGPFNEDIDELGDEYSGSESDDDFDEYNDDAFDDNDDVDDLEIIDGCSEPNDVQNQGDFDSTPNETVGGDKAHDEYRQRSISSTSTEAGFLPTSEVISGSDSHSMTSFDPPSSAPILDGNELQTSNPGKLRRTFRDKERNRQPDLDELGQGASIDLPTPPTTGRSDKTYSHGSHDGTSAQALPDRDLESDRSQDGLHRNQVHQVPRQDLLAEAHDDIIFSGGLDRMSPIQHASVASAIEEFPNYQGRASCGDRPTSLSEKAKGKKRKASQPPSQDRSSTRLSLKGTAEYILPSTFNGLVEDQVHSSTSIGESSKSGHLASKRIARNSTHPGCIAGQPCCHPLVGDYTASVPPVRIYHNTLHANRQTTVAEVEYILSQCNCHWASFFGMMWESWCRQAGEDQYTSLAELLLHPTWHDDELRDAAADCCPRGERVVICLDDD